MEQAPSRGFSRFLHPGRRSPRRGRLACAVLVVLFLALLAAGKGAQFYLALDVFSHFRLQLLLGIVAFTIGGLMRRARVLTGIVILIGGLVAIGLYPQVESELKHTTATPPPGTRALRVMSFNMSLLNRRGDLVRAEIERVNPDVVTLIEISPTQRNILDELRATYPYSSDCLNQSGCYFAMLSRFPFTPRIVKTDWKTPRMISARFGAELGNLTLLGVHMLRFPHSRNQMIQVKALSAVLEAIPGAKIVMGDFNATGFSLALQRFEALSGMHRFTSLPTWPSTARLPQIGIDHIFASPGIKGLTPARIGHYAGSDHYPVEVTLAVPVK